MPNSLTFSFWSQQIEKLKTYRRKRVVVVTMISILAQERLLGAALGSACVGTIVFEQRRGIYGSIVDDKSVQIKKYEPRQIIPWKNSSDLAVVWNKAIDGTLGQLVSYLSSRRW